METTWLHVEVEAAVGRSGLLRHRGALGVDVKQAVGDLVASKAADQGGHT